MKIKILIVVVILLIITLLSKNTASYDSPYEHPALEEIRTIWTEEELLTLSAKIATEHNVSVAQMQSVIQRECPWNFKDGVKYYDESNAQSRLRYNEGQISRHSDWGKVGDRERSHGCAQIHEPAHPEISREQALDPVWSFTYLAENLAKGNGGIWTTYQP